MNKQQKIRIGIIAAGLVLAVAIVAAVIVTVGGSTSAYNSHMELAQQYFDNLQYEQAIAEYKAAIEIEPNSKEAYLALAGIYVQQGDYEAALAILNQGLEQTEAEELKVQVEAVSKQYEEVQALQAEQDRKEEELARGAEEERKREEEERAKEEAEKTKEAEYNKHIEAAEQYIAEKEYEQALKEYEAVLELYPDRMEIYSAMAELYVMMENFEAAIEVLNQGIEQTEDEKLIARLKELQEQYVKIEKPKEAESVVGETGNSGNAGSGRQEIVYDDGVILCINEYDGNEKIVKETWYIEGEMSWYALWEYAKDGSWSRVTDYNLEGMTTGSDLYEYYENGNMKHTFYDSNGMIFCIQEYDKNGQVVEEIMYSENGVMMSHVKVTGNKTTFYNADGTMSHYYISEGDKTTYYNADGTIDYYTIFFRDDRGVGIEWYNADGTIMTDEEVMRRAGY